jgi:hypothetical protein
MNRTFVSQDDTNKSEIHTIRSYSPQELSLPECVEIGDNYLMREFMSMLMPALLNKGWLAIRVDFDSGHNIRSEKFQIESHNIIATIIPVEEVP